MSYADLTYYRATYLGDDPGDPELQKLLDRAADDIDMFCTGPLALTEYTSGQQSLIKKANCAQTEYYVINGETYNTGSAESESIGKYSHSGGSPGFIAPRAKNYLFMAGIARVAVPVLGRTCCE